MPAEYRIDSKQNVVFMTAWGMLGAEDVLAVRKDLCQDPDFSPAMKQLVDLQRVTEVMPGGSMKDLASSDPFGAGARRAFVAPTDLCFGMGRVYEVFTKNPEAEIMVFRTADEACEWLEIAHLE